MNTDYFKIYKDSIFTLAKTLRIKSKTTARLINDLLGLKYGSASINQYEPTTWKYYLNLAGEYYSIPLVDSSGNIVRNSNNEIVYLYQDTLMYINSLDNGAKILFNKTNLNEHPATKASYVYGTKYYYNLLANYPEQEQLILGIIYPVDINVAVDADDGKILAYPSYLVEPQEISLIDNLQTHVSYMLRRWDVPAFGISDSLYPAASLSILYLSLVPKILNLRLAKCKTIEAHSFHIKQYLASHHGLDIYYPYISLEQALFLYRNILYLERHSGSQYNFNLLLKNMLTKGKIPLFEFQMRHLGTFDNQYLPNYNFVPNALNNINSAIEKSSFTIDEVLEKEANDGVDTADYINNQFKKIDGLFKLSKSNVVETKLLESAMIDYSDYTPYPLSDALVNHWIYFSTQNMYNALIKFNNTANGEDYTLCAQDAFIYLLYLTSITLNNPMVFVPEGCIVSHVQKPFMPTLNELNSLVVTKNIKGTNKDICKLSQYINDSETGLQHWLIDNQPAINAFGYDNILEFYQFVYSLYSHQQNQLLLISSQEEYFNKAMVKRLVEYFYATYQVNFYNTITEQNGTTSVDNSSPIGSGVLFTNWLNDKGLYNKEIGVKDAGIIIKNILNEACGYNLNIQKSLKNIQSSLVNIVKKLSSYSLQFVYSINDSNIKALPNTNMQYGNNNAHGEGEIFNPKIDVEPIYVKGEAELKLNSYFNDTEFAPNNQFHVAAVSATNKLDISLQSNLNNLPFTRNIEVNFGIFSLLNVNYPTYNPNGNVLNKMIIGYEYFENLTLQQKNSLVDQYGNNGIVL